MNNFNTNLRKITVSVLPVVVFAISFCFLLSNPSVHELFIAFLVGLFIGIVEYAYFKKMHPPLNRWQLGLGAVLGVPVCIFAARRFHRNWMQSTSMIRTFLEKLFPDFSMVMSVITVILGILSLSFLALTFGVFIYYGYQILRTISYKEIVKELIDSATVKAVLKRTLTVIGSIILSALCGAMLLVSVYALPTESMDRNLSKSAATLEAEGTYPVISRFFTSKLDNWTDSIILLEAVTSTGEPVLDAMNASRFGIKGQKAHSALIEHYIHGTEFDNISSYGRYWHGYLVLIKPLLGLMPISGIRIINGLMQLFLVAAVITMLYKKGAKNYIIPYTISYLMLMPLALARCFQFSSCFYVLTLGALALLLMKDDKLREKAYLVFLFCGIGTAFLDFFTYPIATFGVPMIFFLILTEKDSLEDRLAGMIRSGFYWCIGFGGMWSAKWILGSIITGENIIADGVNTMFKRSAALSDDQTEKISVFSVLIRNYAAFLKTPVTVLMVVFIVYIIVKLVRGKKLSFREAGEKFLPYILVALAPLVWYAFATNHSMVHSWFTNKACVVTFLALMAANNEQFKGSHQ
jgi:hypothetical protein